MKLTVNGIFYNIFISNERPACALALTAKEKTEILNLSESFCDVQNLTQSIKKVRLLTDD